MATTGAFPVGAAVEIASDDDGFRGSWYTGTVLRHISVSSSAGRGKGKKKAKAAAADAAITYLIEFDMLFEDEEGTKRLTEEVGEWQLRPVPPPEPKRAYKQGDEVDAFHNDGWWEGSVTEELGNGKFEVYFRSTKESIQFKDDCLRIHREWINDDWSPPFDKQQNGLPAKEMTVSEGRSPRNPRLKKEELIRKNGLPAKEVTVAETSTSKLRKRASVENGLPSKEVTVVESITPRLRKRASVENGSPAKEVKVAESSTPKLRRRAVENGLPAKEVVVAESSTPKSRKRASVENGLPAREVAVAESSSPPNLRKRASVENVEQRSTSSLKFRKGLFVEVSSDEDGFRGAWFSAKIDKEISKGKYRVQYQGLRNEDDTDFLYEEIDALYIRPTPPKRKTSGAYKVLEEVDALYNEGWWVGVICKVLENSRYVVFFRDTNEELEFSASDLRPHREWINSKWVTLSQL